MKHPEIIFATRNPHKVAEVQSILNEYGIQIRSMDEVLEIPDIEESGQTFEENALLKARTVFAHTGKWCLADDSGLEVDALNGAPGIYSARFAGVPHDYQANNEKLLEMLKDVPDPRRGAQFRCVVAIVGPNFSTTVEGIVRGHIIHEPRGNKGFGYDPLFVPEGYQQTFAELGETIKNRISHRAIAFRKAATILLRLFQSTT
ncbi:MAG: XTP/dITP diphosphatase [Calditrichaeota bacterium]|nr:XTP/dITP diphosphatase [Calditrichota bacterium]